jgi:hypothetical protein
MTIGWEGQYSRYEATLSQSLPLPPSRYGQIFQGSSVSPYAKRRLAKKAIKSARIGPSFGLLDSGNQAVPHHVACYAHFFSDHDRLNLERDLYPCGNDRGVRFWQLHAKKPTQRISSITTF